MSKSHRLAWAAGFMDGDGFITIQSRTTKVNGKIYSSTYLRMGACQATEVPLKELHALFGGNIRSKNSGPNPQGYNRKPQWVWTLSTMQASAALEQLLPYLIHKKEVALLALKFQQTMGTTKATTEETKTYRLELKQQIQALNSEN